MKGSEAVKLKGPMWFKIVVLIPLASYFGVLLAVEWFSGKKKLGREETWGYPELREKYSMRRVEISRGFEALMMAFMLLAIQTMLLLMMPLAIIMPNFMDEGWGIFLIVIFGILSLAAVCRAISGLVWKHDVDKTVDSMNRELVSPRLF